MLDLLRGIALFGTLGTNIWIFTNPAGPPAALDGPGSTGTFSSAFENFVLLLSNGKFLALLTLLFGIGLELQYRSAVRKGARWPGWYLWRALLLLVEGLLHFVLIFEFDVLMTYAVTSMLAAFLIARSNRVIRAWIGALASLHIAAASLITVVLLTTDEATSPTPDNGLFTTGSYLDQLMNRLDNFLFYRLEAIIIIPMSMALFLVGVQLLRAGVFQADRQRLRTRLMIIGLGVATPLNLLTAFSGPNWFMIDRYVLPPLVALGLLGLVATVAQNLPTKAGLVRRGTTAVGRTALSCYIIQNLLAATLCYGWGFGLAAQFDAARPWWVIGAWAGICLALMIMATYWTRRFGRGPVEMAWHWAFQAPQQALARHR